MAVTYLPTVRNLISDEDKKRICEAEWEFVWIKPETRQSFVNGVQTCPFKLIMNATSLPSPAAAQTYLYGAASAVELRTFMTCWDLGRIQPGDLPAILGYEPAP